MSVATEKWTDPKAADELAVLRRKVLSAMLQAEKAVEAYRETDKDGLHKRLSREAITNIFPNFVSWKGTCKLLNDRKKGRDFRTLYGIYVSLGIPMWNWIVCDWDHRNTRQTYSVSDLGRSSDEKMHNCEYAKVPG